ncbi:MAG: sigma-70 family RNA polymerase sigma factor [Clostridia bacterium]|nr:sigma-70 family RNA polymerase sigma factor [Clostridia bacterium]
MTGTAVISPFYILGRDAFLLLASLAGAEYEIENDAALVREKAGYYFDAFGNSILRLAYSYLHNTDDSEEVLQDTLIQYIRSAPRFSNDGHAKVWLMRVAANLSKNRIRYNSTRRADELNEELAAEESEDLSFVWEAVKRLKPKYREVIHLYYQEGYSASEIAEILGRNENSVRSDMKRGRDQLKEILKGGFDFE